MQIEKSQGRSAQGAAHLWDKSFLTAFHRYLCSKERAAATVQKYLRAAGEFAAWLGERPVCGETAAAWKAALLSRGQRAATVNGKLAALNALFGMLGWHDCRVQALRVQRRAFCDDARELTYAEYLRLVRTARKKGDERLALLLETIGGTGIRVSEVRAVTVEALRRGKAEISLKGKIRTVLLPGKLCRKLMAYAARKKIASGAVFRTRSGSPMSRKWIWEQMKALSLSAGVAPGKVFPHNLRHLFARTFYHATHDIAQLADVLGHSSLSTTRIYLISTGTEHRRTLDRLGFVS